MQNKIIETCDQICSMLVEKNVKYGNSALDPVRVFSKASTTEQLLVRIKTTGMEAPDEDTLNDLIGYLILLKIATKNENNTEDKNTYEVDKLMTEFANHIINKKNDTRR
jgi:hypothetical protein